MARWAPFLSLDSVIRRKCRAVVHGAGVLSGMQSSCLRSGPFGRPASHDPKSGIHGRDCPRGPRCIFTRFAEELLLLPSSSFPLTVGPLAASRGASFQCGSIGHSLQIWDPVAALAAQQGTGRNGLLARDCFVLTLVSRIAGPARKPRLYGGRLAGLAACR